MYNKILVTGGAGFIGSNFIRYMLKVHNSMQIVNLDLLTYAGNVDNLADVASDGRYTFVKGDICDSNLVGELVQGVDAVINFAAESHVDRSIANPDVFVRTNVLGTQVLLEASRRHQIKRYFQISTDEVYGTLGATGYFVETTPLAPNSPYSASKASADFFVRAYHETYGLPTVITRCSNNYGPYQYPEKLIPALIFKAMHDEPLPIYGDGKNVRDWLHVEDHCRAIDRVLHDGRDGEVYNVGGNNEWANIDIAKLILKKLGKSESLISYVKDRLGHDRRYAIDASKIRTELSWEPEVTFEQGLADTVDFYVREFDKQK